MFKISVLIMCNVNYLIDLLDISREYSLQKTL